MNDLYDMLKSAYNNAMQVCDPVDYKARQQNLLRCISYYLLEKDKPKAEEKPASEDSPNE